MDLKTEKAKPHWVAGGCLLNLGIVLAALLLTGCATPKAVEEHHHHYQEVDTAAVQAIVDGRMVGWHEEVTAQVEAAVTQYQAEQQSTEDSKERITETITTWVDSLGREMRQEQRTTERDISRQQRIWEERLERQYEERLLTAMDSMSQAWQERFDSVSAHKEEADSTALSEVPMPMDNRPWYKRWWDAMRWMLLGAGVFAVGWFTKKLWLPLVKW